MTKLLILVCLSAASLSAASINLCSDLLNEGNQVTATNVGITANPAWAQPGACGHWISFDNTGDGGVVLSNSDVSQSPTSVFFESFFLGSNRTGTVTIWADDTARVRLVNALNPGNGLMLVDANPIQDGACAAGTIACEPLEGFTVALDQHLAAGMNTLYIDAYQRGGGPFAIMYTGSANSTLTPEPGTYALLGSGLVGLWFARRRKVS
jgi:hypothetical protein